MNLPVRNLWLFPAVMLLAACGGADESRNSLVDIAQAAARQTDRVDVETLAEWLIEERQDFVLVDVRSSDDHAEGHISGARHIPIAELLADENLASLPRDRKFVVYANGSANGAKGGKLLRVARMFETA